MRNRDMDMTQGTIWRQIVAFAAPMLLGLIFQQLYNTVDTLVVGQFVGKNALAAVGCTGSLTNTLVGFCAGLATGSSVVISQSYGAHDHKRLHEAVQTSILVTLILCAAVTVLGIILVDPLLKMMCTPDDVMQEATIYLRIYFEGITGLLLYNMGSGIMRAVGDSQRPLYFLIFSAVINTVLDILFVVVFKMGVAGVAWATVIAQALSAMLCLWSLTKTETAYSIDWKDLKISRNVLKSILSIGLPSAIQTAVTSFSNVFVQSYINAFGSASMAGYAAYNKLDAFVMVPMTAISMASTTFTGQNWGAGQVSRTRQGVRSALLMSLGCTGVLCVLQIIFARTLLHVFTTDAEVVRYGQYYINVITPFYLLICFTQIYSGALRGIGCATTPTLIMLGSYVAFRQLYLFVTIRVLNGGIGFVAMAYPVGWILCTILLTIFYRRSPMFRTPDKETV